MQIKFSWFESRSIYNGGWNHLSFLPLKLMYSLRLPVTKKKNINKCESWIEVDHNEMLVEILFNSSYTNNSLVLAQDNNDKMCQNAHKIQNNVSQLLQEES